MTKIKDLLELHNQRKAVGGLCVDAGESAIEILSNILNFKADDAFVGKVEDYFEQYRIGELTDNEFYQAVVDTFILLIQESKSKLTVVRHDQN